VLGESLRTHIYPYLVIIIVPYCIIYDAVYATGETRDSHLPPPRRQTRIETIHENKIIVLIIITSRLRRREDLGQWVSRARSHRRRRRHESSSKYPPPPPPAGVRAWYTNGRRLSNAVVATHIDIESRYKNVGYPAVSVHPISTQSHV